jgi:thiamine transport system ATP-binding protein
MTEAGLTVEDVSVRYGNRAAVDGVSLAVAPGEIVALLGPSGCGKSTLLRAIAGLEPLAGGTIRWDGVDLAGVPVHRRRFGLMFQDGQLFPHQTVAQNVGYGLTMGGVRGQARADAVAELLTLVDLADLGGRSVTTLSGGQAQRVALARALAPEPRLLLLDEPLSSLDAELREQLRDELRAIIIRTGTAGLWVTHDPAEADAVADRVLRMRAGHLVSGPLARP